MRAHRFRMTVGAVLAAALLGACTSKTSKDTSIPWSRPADWEGQMPGMGGMDVLRRLREAAPELAYGRVKLEYMQSFGPVR